VNHQKSKRGVIMSSAVSRPIAAASLAASAYYHSLLEYETDCWDVHHAISNHRKDFVLLDVRGQESYQKGHLPEAVLYPHSKLKQKNLTEYAADTLFVVYCAGPHCNGADKAALKLAELGRPVKKMIGGITGWLDEGFNLVSE
jgi:rhodanese-related sulfurtransferase